MCSFILWFVTFRRNRAHQQTFFFCRETLSKHTMGNCSFHEVVPPVRPGRSRDTEATDWASRVSETHTSDIASGPGDTMRRSVSWQRADGSIRGLRVGHTVTIVGDTRRRKQNTSFRSLVASPSKSSSLGMQATNPLARSPREHSLERIDRTASTSQHSSASLEVSTRMPTNPPANLSNSIFFVDDVEEQPETFVAMQLPECWAVQLRGAAASADA